MKQKEIIEVIKNLRDCPEHSTSKWHVYICANKLIEKLETKQLILSGVSQQSELLMATLTSRVLTIQNEPDGVVRETMINNLLIDINCG